MSNHPKKLRLAVAVALGLLMAGCGDKQPAQQINTAPAAVDTLAAGFANPPNDARPRVWWHWMNGNITQDGIAKDLAWMQRVGIGGLQNFDAAMETPIVVDKRLPFMSPEWKDAMRFAVTKADELGLEFAIASSAGWSETGGPWVTPEDGMKKLVWSETLVNGGQAFKGQLPAPPSTTGPYHNLKAVTKHAHSPEAVPDSFYRDVAVLAYPMAAAAKPATPTLSLDGKALAAESLQDSDPATGIDLPAGQGSEPAVIAIDFDQPQTIQSAVVHVANLPASFMTGPLQPRLEAKADDGQWQPVAEFPLKAVPTTLSFAPVTASQFRLIFSRAEKSNSSMFFKPSPGVDPSGLGGIGAMMGSTSKPQLTDLRLFSDAKVNAFEVKAGFALVDNYYQLDSNAGPEVAGVDPAQVVELTDKMTADGELNWEAPPGQWQVLRLGYSLTGKTNAPATLEATGLEVDKYDGAAVERYLNHYLGMYREVVGDDLMGQRGLKALLTDSTEVGPSNWTPALREQFKKLRGYDPTPWLPVLTGAIIGSRQQSDRFLHDFRRTLAELVASEHYGTVAKVAHANGLMVYGESLEANRMVSSLGDDLEMRRFADIPMAAMWAFGGDNPKADYIADMRGAASVAHIHGKPFVAAESLTSIMNPWAHGPAELQPMIDAEFASGINRPVIHTSVHQPVDDKVPGMSLHVFGQYFTRHDTWAEMAKPWIDYIARNSFLLQQGSNVADVAYFYGEEPPIGVQAQKGYPTDVPKQYGYDFVSPHDVLNAFKVEGNELVSVGGARYQVLYLGGGSSEFISLPILQRMAQLVEEGATLVGKAPTASPSLGDDQQAFAALVAKLWAGEGTTVVGKGKVIAGNDVEAALAQQGAAPEVTLAADAPVQFVHRKLDDGDLYYLSNRGEARQLDISFRVNGKAPEIWRADSGAIADASYRADNGRTVVPLNLGDKESLFVVFRDAASETARTVPTPVPEVVADIAGPWQVSFQAQRGAPASTVLDSLQSLSEQAEPGIKYFSGVASYNQQFELPAGVTPGNSLLLDLGAIGDVAEVLVNGQSAGIAWKKPYQVDIGKLVKAGSNKLEIRVANLWVNRLIGDAQPEAEKVAYTTFKTYLPSAPLRPSGLLGPVRLLAVR